MIYCIWVWLVTIFITVAFDLVFHIAMIEDLITELSMNHSRDSKRIESLIEYSSTPIPPPKEGVIGMNG